MKFKHNTERFPFGFLLTPPIIDSVEAKKNFGVKFLLDLKNHKLSNSFRVFCESIDQVSRIHFDRIKNNNMPSQPQERNLRHRLATISRRLMQLGLWISKKFVTKLEEQANRIY